MSIERRTFLKGVGAFSVLPFSLSRIARAAVAESGIPVLVHYANWHEKEGTSSSWHITTTQPVYSDGFCVPDPKAPEGFDCFTGYRSLDRATIEHHNAEFAANGLVPLISWWDKVGEPNERSGDLFLDLYFSIASPVKVGLLYEITGRLAKTQIGTLPGGRVHEGYDFGSDASSENAQRFIADVVYLNEKYIKVHPERFFRIDGKPVVFLWLSHAFSGRFDLAVAELRKSVPVFLIGSDFSLLGAPPGARTPAVLNTIRGLDAVSAYGIYDGPMATRYGGHLSREYVDQYAMSILSWSTWLRENAPGVKLMVPTMFTYHDTKGSPALDKTTPDEARYLARIARALVEEGLDGCAPVVRAILHVSWNEHFEGTSIEDTVQHGDAFRNILRETMSAPLVRGVGCTAR